MKKRLWMVRAGREGERELAAIDQNRLLPGFAELGDLSKFSSRESLSNYLLQMYPDHKKMSRVSYAGQLYRFVHEIQIDDLVVMPRKLTTGVAIGEIKSPYIFKPEDQYKHFREVKWLAEAEPRDTFKQDLLNSLGAFMTICEIKRNFALNRVIAVLKDGKDPGPIMGSKNSGHAQASDEYVDVEDYAIDIEDVAVQQIISLIKSEFAGHALAELVAEILRAQGYTTKVSPPGPDQGVDILATGGKLGIGEERICVQVKSGDGLANQTVVMQLLGAVKAVGAQTGLLVSISGVNSAAQRFLDQNFFELRLWQMQDFLKALFRSYGSLSDQTRAKLPLKQIWVPISEGDL